MIALVLAATPPLWLSALAAVAAGYLVVLSVAVSALLVKEARNGNETARVVLLTCSAILAVFIFLVWVSVSQAATLSFTLPATTQQRNVNGSLVSCTGGDSLRTLAGWRIFAQVQAPQWTHHKGSMLGHDIYWQIWWPQVREAAMPRQVKSASTLNLPRRGAGHRVTVDVPDSLDVDTGYGVFRQPVICWYVETFNDSLKASCPSNLRSAR